MNDGKRAHGKEKINQQNSRRRLRQEDIRIVDMSAGERSRLRFSTERNVDPSHADKSTNVLDI